MSLYLGVDVLLTHKEAEALLPWPAHSVQCLGPLRDHIVAYREVFTSLRAPPVHT